jgi:hypothetical protein
MPAAGRRRHHHHHHRRRRLFWQLLSERQQTKQYLYHSDYSEVVTTYDLHGRCGYVLCARYRQQRCFVRHYQKCF